MKAIFWNIGALLFAAAREGAFRRVAARGGDAAGFTLFTRFAGFDVLAGDNRATATGFFRLVPMPQA